MRAWLASRREGDHPLSSRSLSQALSAVRSFHRFLDLRLDAPCAAITLVKGPKVRPGPPRPVSEDQARGLILEAANDPMRDDWESLRDAAVLTLLWGCGLRISEALAITAAEAPFGDAIWVLPEGAMFAPSYLGGAVRGMHGYDLGAPSSRATSTARPSSAAACATPRQKASAPSRVRSAMKETEAPPSTQSRRMVARSGTASATCDGVREDRVSMTQLLKSKGPKEKGRPGERAALVERLGLERIRPRRKDRGRNSPWKETPGHCPEWR